MTRRAPEYGPLFVPTAEIVPDQDGRLTLNDWALRIRALNNQWWYDINTGEKLDRNHGELFMLMVSEVAEAMESHRKSLKDEKLPHRQGVDVELVDALIRIFDYAGEHGIDLDAIMREKLVFNLHRSDHKRENRAQDGGKKY